MTAGRHAARRTPSRRHRARTTVGGLAASGLVTAVTMGSILLSQSTLALGPASAASRASAPVAHATVVPVETGVVATVLTSGVSGADRTGPATRVTRTETVAGCPVTPLPEHVVNGTIPRGSLCALPDAEGQLLRPDAAAAWVRLDAAYVERFGEHICITDTYRSLKAQKQLFKRKPALAAFPGTSNHGLGGAVDLCGGIEHVDSVQHIWLGAHGAAFGWTNPAWAQPGGSSKFEPWHWEYDALSSRM